MTDTSAQTAVDTAPAPEAPAPEAKKVPTAREALQAASEKVAVAEAAGTTETEKALRVLKGEPEDPPEQKAKAKPKAEPKADAEPKKTEAKPKETEPKEAEAKGPERGEDGKFKSNQPKAAEPAESTIDDEDEEDERAPPKRFSKQAQAEWENAPESVRHETRRAIKEIEQGLTEHQERSTRWKTEIEPYETLAKSYGLDGVKGVLADYEGMARMMATDPLKVFNTLASRHGLSLEKIASHVLDRELDEYAQQTGQQIASLTQQLQAAQAELNQFRTEKTRSVQSFVTEFAEKHPRYAELEQTISWILATNGVDRSDPKKALKEAYAMAERLKPAASETSFPQVAAQPTRTDLSAQTAVASKSVTGAPGQGSNPANRKPSASARESLLSAARRTGLA